MVGIYCIENKINYKRYIGSSIDIKHRFYRHKSDLKYNRNGNIYLQRSYNKYGKNNFRFYIIQDCKEDELIDLESLWMRHHKSLNRNYGYNIASDTECPVRGLICTEETRKKISLSKIGNKNCLGKKCSVEKRNKIGKSNRIYNLKPIQMLDKNTNEVIINFSSATEASLYLGNKKYNSNIGLCCYNNSKSAYGYKWKFIND